MTYRTPLLCLGAATLLLAACSESHPVAPLCSPSSEESCVGPNSCSGARLCNAEGSAYGACVCADSGMPDGGPPDAGDAVPDGGDPDASMMVDGGNALLDQCLGASDTAALAALVDGGTGVEAAQLLVLNCTLYSCLDEVQNYSGALSCIETCLDSTDLDALSTACTSCFVDMEVCAFDQCIIVCAGNDADACSTCIEAYCAPARTNCIGF